MLLVAIPLLIIIALLFFFIASVDGAMFGTPDDELDNIIAQKMQELVNEGGVSESTSLSPGESFQKVQIGFKLIPQLDQHSFLLKRMALVSGQQSGEVDEYNSAAVGDLSQSYFSWSAQGSHAGLPSLNFDESHVPVGDSAYMCLGLSWASLKKRNQYDKYADVQGMD